MRRNRIFKAGALALFLAVFLLSPAVASAGKWRVYDPAAFAESRKAGKTVIVSVHADW